MASVIDDRRGGAEKQYALNSLLAHARARSKLGLHSTSRPSDVLRRERGREDCRLPAKSRWVSLRSSLRASSDSSIETPTSGTPPKTEPVLPVVELLQATLVGRGPEAGGT